MKTLLAIGCVLLLTGAMTASAQDPPTDFNFSRRLEQLEVENRQLRRQMESLEERERTLQPAPILANPAGMTTEMADLAPAGVVPAALAPGASPGEDERFTLEELRGEMRKLAWTKGDFTVVPYGTLWGNMVYESHRTQVGDYTLYVLPDRPNTEEQFHLDPRSTRLGLDVSGPQVPLLNCAPSGGKVEIDFQRNLDTENRSGLLLRHAYLEVKNEDFRLLFGQTWDVISPLYPGVLMYSVGWGGGNIGYRRAQLRGERYLALSDCVLVNLQGSLNTDIVALNEFSGTGFIGDQAGWPILMARVGTTLGPRGKDSHPMDLGVSGHIGEQIFDFRSPFLNPVTGLAAKTWSVNADWRIPLSSRLGVQGEFFTGANLGAYFGGIVQGVDIGTPADPGSRAPIRSTGGWIDVWYDWTPRLHSHLGYSIDDPVNGDVTTGRIYNAFWFGNVTYDLTARFLVGFEFTQWKTTWVPQGPVDSAHLDFVAKYSF